MKNYRIKKKCKACNEIVILKPDNLSEIPELEEQVLESFNNLGELEKPQYLKNCTDRFHQCKDGFTGVLEHVGFKVDDDSKSIKTNKKCNSTKEGCDHAGKHKETGYCNWGCSKFPDSKCVEVEDKK